MAKRTANHDINHDNWDQDLEHEEAGVFKRATDQDLTRRVVKTAKRRLGSGIPGSSDETPVKNPFGAFAGFKGPATTMSSPFSFLSSATTAAKPSPQTSTFSFSKTPTNNGEAKLPENGGAKDQIGTNKSDLNLKPAKVDDKKADNLNESLIAACNSKIKILNESVAQWIKQHVEKDPYCILTPIFRDYEKYLKEIEKERDASTCATPIKAQQGTTLDNRSVVKNPCSSSNFKTLDSATDNTSGFVTGSFDRSSTPEAPFDSGSNIPMCRTSTKLDKKLDETPSIFSFGQKTQSSTTTGFSFGGVTKPFSFSAQSVKPPQSENTGNEETAEDDEPPKPNFTPVTESGAIYEQRCKVFVKKDSAFSDRGVGTLFLKPTPNDKIQLIVRAETSLGNLLLNTLLNGSIPIKRMNKNTVMIVCLPLPDTEPPPTPVLLRVKTSEDADKLFDALDKHKK